MFQSPSQKRAKHSSVLPGNIKGAFLNALHPFMFKDQNQHFYAVPKNFSDP